MLFEVFIARFSCYEDIFRLIDLIQEIHKNLNKKKQHFDNKAVKITIINEC